MLTQPTHRKHPRKNSLLVPVPSKVGAELFYLVSILNFFPTFLKEFLSRQCGMLSTNSESCDLKEFYMVQIKHFLFMSH